VKRPQALPVLDYHASPWPGILRRLLMALALLAFGALYALTLLGLLVLVGAVK
jgi:hypothetical protein